MRTPTNPLVTTITSSLAGSALNEIPNVYAVRRTFTGSTIPTLDLDLLLLGGVYRFDNTVTCPSSPLPSDATSGFVVCLALDYEEASAYMFNRIRQNIYLDDNNNIYTRTAKYTYDVLSEVYVHEWTPWQSVGATGISSQAYAPAGILITDLDDYTTLGLWWVGGTVAPLTWSNCPPIFHTGVATSPGVLTVTHGDAGGSLRQEYQPISTNDLTSYVRVYTTADGWTRWMAIGRHKSMSAGVLTADLFSNSNSIYMEPGVYQVSSANSPFDVDPPIGAGWTGFLVVHATDIDELSGDSIRQVLYPNNISNPAPWTRVYNSSWSVWVMFGGSLLRTELIDAITDAQINRMYYSFGEKTLILPNAASVPEGTIVGLEQYVGSGAVKAEWVSDGVYAHEQITSVKAVSIPRITVSGAGIANVNGLYEVTNSVFSGGSRVWLNKAHPEYYIAMTIVDEEGTVRWSIRTEDAISYYLPTEQIDPYSSTSWKIFAGANITLTLTTSVPASTVQIYKFEVCLNSSGVKEWIAEVGVDFDAYIAELMSRFRTLSDTLNAGLATIDGVADDLVATLSSKGRRTIYGTDANLPLTYVDNTLTASIGAGDGSGATVTCNLKHYDAKLFILTNGNTIALPNASTLLVGTTVTVEIIPTRTCTIAETNGTWETFSNTTDKVLLLIFQVSLTTGSARVWNMLSL